MAMFIDIHAHLDQLKDLDQVMDRARQAGVKVIIANGVDPQTNRTALQLSEKYDIVKPALGIYPPDALEAEIAEGEYTLEPKPIDLDEEIEFIKSKNPVALGEIGLDYKTGTDFPAQKALFQRFIELSEKTDTPMIIHSRKAEADVLDMLESSDAKKIVLHCFCGKFSLIKRARDNGWSFTIPTNVVRSEHFQKMIDMINLSQLLTETDSPCLSPFRDRPNEPAFVVESTKKIAEIKKMTIEDTASNIFMNYQKMFLK